MTTSQTQGPMTRVSPIGVVGTGVMGASLARNLARSLDKPIAVFDLDQAKVDALVDRHPEANLLGFSDLSAFVAALEQSKDATAFERITQRWGVRRSHPQFWYYFHDLARYIEETEPLETGVLDMNRYQNL